MFTITLAVIAGSILLVILLYGLSPLSVPVIVFFPAYAIYFFATRYPRLANLIYALPPPPPGTVPTG